MRSYSLFADFLGLGPPLRWTGRKLLFLWVRTRVLPEDVAGQRVPSNVPVLYVLANNALSTRLVVEEVCARQDIATPSEAPMDSEYRSVVFLRRLRGWFPRRGEPVKSPRLTRMIEAVRTDPSLDIAVVPVTVFWGRSPDKEKSPLKLLFSESWAPAGRFRKMLIILFHGRNTLVQFSEPVMLRQFVDEAMADGLDPERTQRKLSRVLRVHMRRLRVATIGPDLSHRRTLRGQILRSASVREAIEQQASRNAITVEAATHEAGEYIDEISADYSPVFIRAMERLLGWLWNRVYDGIEVGHIDQLKTVAESNGVIYVPCHRSHFDYLLLSYVVYQAGLVPPHVAAGINLNIPIVGPFLRRGGAFFLRRTFGGNKLYTAVFQKYLALNLSKGVPIEYFIEGTRSRTGRLLQPKSGMLAMTVRSHMRTPETPVVFVPVYFGYEILLEGRSYIRELSGKPKKKESFIGFVRFLGALRRKLGKVYVNFGEPIELDPLLDKHNPGWRENPSPEASELAPVVDEVADRIMRSINMCAAVPPVSLLSVPLLSAPRQAMLEEVLRPHLDMMLSMLDALPYSERVTVPEMTGHSIIEYAEEMNLVKRRSHALGDVLAAQGKDAIMMTYNRNNVMHLFLMPSMIACCFLNNREMRVDKIVEMGSMVYPYVQSELFLRWADEEVSQVIIRIIDVLADHGLLEWSASRESCSRPAAGSIGAIQLSMLAHGALQRLERYYMTIALLLKHGPGHISQSDLENLCALMAQRMSMLYQFDAPESFAKPLFRDFVNKLRDLGVVWCDDDGLLAFDDRIRGVEDDAKLVLGEQIRHSILQVIHV